MASRLRLKSSLGVSLWRGLDGTGHQKTQRQERSLKSTTEAQQIDFMLVLTRKLNQSIVILLPTGETITVKMTGYDRDGKGVRVGIDAPKHIIVHRQEVFDSIKAAEASQAKWGVSGVIEGVTVGQNPTIQSP